MDRPTSWRALAIDLEAERPFRVGGASIDPLSRDAEFSGRRERLQPQNLKVLVALVRRRGKVVTRAELIDSCWDGRVIGEDVINRSISLLRDFAGRAGGFSIETVPKTGYRLIESGALKTGLPLRWTAAAAALATAAIAGLMLISRSDIREEPATLTIAVLPFKNLSDHPDHLAEGLTEEIAGRLAEQTSLEVAGTASSSLFGRGDTKAAGRALSVRYVVEGSVRRRGEDIRVVVALLNARDGMRLWSRSFDGTTDDLLAIQAQIGQEVVEHIGLKLAPRDQDRERPNAEAYALYVTAKGLLMRAEPAKNEAALGLLRDAVRIDPLYADAWARLALAERQTRIDREGGIRVRRSLGGPELAAARRALSLNPHSAEAHAIYAVLRDLDAASIPHLQTAVRLQPSNAEYWWWLGRAKGRTTDFTGSVRAFLRSAELDPLWEANGLAAAIADDAGLRDEARLILRQIISRHPDPYNRWLERARLAAFTADYSNTYLYSKRALAVARPDDRQEARDVMAWTLLRVGLYAEAKRVANPRTPWALIAEGRTDTKALQEFFPEPRDFWLSVYVSKFVARAWTTSGNGRELLRVYDQAFRSPDEFRTTFRNELSDFVYFVPLLAKALTDAGREPEALRLVDSGRQICATMLGQKLVSQLLRSRCTLLAGATGQKDRAIAELTVLVDEGWQPDVSGRPSLVSEPALARIRNDPRLIGLDRRISREINRERRETLALL